MLIFKVDFEKAFDSVSWKYLDYMLHSLGFGLTWRSWIKACLESSRTSILVNGSPTSELSVKRVLRQGDPLSPFLFIIVMEGLHMAFSEAFHSGLLHGVKIVFYLASSLKINIYKSNVYGVGVSDNEVHFMATDIGCSPGSFPFTYLGLPIGANMNLTEGGFGLNNISSKGIWSKIVGSSNFLHSNEILPSDSIRFRVGCGLTFLLAGLTFPRLGVLHVMAMWKHITTSSLIVLLLMIFGVISATGVTSHFPPVLRLITGSGHDDKCKNGQKLIIIVMAVSQHDHVVHSTNIAPTPAPVGVEMAPSATLQACVGMGTVEFGLCVNCFAAKIGLEGNVLVGGYAQCVYGLEAIETVSSMYSKGVLMDEFTFIHALNACFITRDLYYGRQIHALKLFTHLRGSNIKPDECTFSCVVEACFRTEVGSTDGEEWRKWWLRGGGMVV
nr:hypothetical protein [Tanacetum cinerariifolium]